MPHIPLYSTHTYLLLHTSCNPPQPPRATPTAPHGPTLPYSPLSSHIPTTSPPLPLHPQTTSALGGTASRAGCSGFQALMGAAALQRWGPRLLQPPQIPASHGEGDGHGLPSEGTAGRFQAGCQRRALPLSQLEPAALLLSNKRQGEGQKCR